MIPKLNKAFYVIRALKSLLFFKSLMMVYFSTVHSVISYSIIFWGISTYSKIVFKIKKRIIQIITNSDNKASCQELFKKLHVLPLQSQYIFSLLVFVIKNNDIFKTNSEVHNFNTRPKHDLHIPIANLTLFQNGVWHSGIKMYNHLPQTLKELSDYIFKFKVALKNLF
jgi:hypothetical protein